MTVTAHPVTDSEAISAAHERAFLEKKTAEKLVASVTVWRDGFIRTPEALRRNNLYDYSDETLRKLLSAADKGYDYKLVRLILDDTIEDWLLIEPELNDVPDTGIQKALTALHHYEFLAPHERPERRREQITAILRATEHLRGDVRYSQSGIHINDRRLRDLITTHKDPEAVADLIIARDLTDVDTLTAILAVMDSIEPAINDGAL